MQIPDATETDGCVRSPDGVGDEGDVDDTAVVMTSSPSPPMHHHYARLPTSPHSITSADPPVPTSNSMYHHHNHHHHHSHQSDSLALTHSTTGVNRPVCEETDKDDCHRSPRPHSGHQQEENGSSLRLSPCRVSNADVNSNIDGISASNRDVVNINSRDVRNINSRVVKNMNSRDDVDASNLNQDDVRHHYNLGNAKQEHSSMYPAAAALEDSVINRCNDPGPVRDSSADLMIRCSADAAISSVDPATGSPVEVVKCNNGGVVYSKEDLDTTAGDIEATPSEGNTGFTEENIVLVKAKQEQLSPPNLGHSYSFPSGSSSSQSIASPIMYTRSRFIENGKYTPTDDHHFVAPDANDQHHASQAYQSQHAYKLPSPNLDHISNDVNLSPPSVPVYSSKARTMEGLSSRLHVSTTRIVDSSSELIQVPHARSNVEAQRMVQESLRVYFPSVSQTPHCEVSEEAHVVTRPSFVMNDSPNSENVGFPVYISGGPLRLPPSTDVVCPRYTVDEGCCSAESLLLNHRSIESQIQVRLPPAGSLTTSAIYNSQLQDSDFIQKVGNQIQYSDNGMSSVHEPMSLHEQEHSVQRNFSTDLMQLVPENLCVSPVTSEAMSGIDNIGRNPSHLNNVSIHLRTDGLTMSNVHSIDHELERDYSTVRTNQHHKDDEYSIIRTDPHHNMQSHELNEFIHRQRISNIRRDLELNLSIPRNHKMDSMNLQNQDINLNNLRSSELNLQNLRAADSSLKHSRNHNIVENDQRNDATEYSPGYRSQFLLTDAHSEPSIGNHGNLIYSYRSDPSFTSDFRHGNEQDVHASNLPIKLILPPQTTINAVSASQLSANHHAESPLPQMIDHPSETPMPQMMNHPSESPMPQMMNHSSESPMPQMMKHPSESPMPQMMNHPSESPMPQMINHSSESPMPQMMNHPSESPMPQMMKYPSESPMPQMMNHPPKSRMPYHGSSHHLAQSPMNEVTLSCRAEAQHSISARHPVSPVTSHHHQANHNLRLTSDSPLPPNVLYSRPVGSDSSVDARYSYRLSSSDSHQYQLTQHTSAARSQTASSISADTLPITSSFLIQSRCSPSIIDSVAHPSHQLHHSMNNNRVLNNNNNNNIASSSRDVSLSNNVNECLNTSPSSYHHQFILSSNSSDRLEYSGPLPSMRSHYDLASLQQEQQDIASSQPQHHHQVHQQLLQLPSSQQTQAQQHIRRVEDDLKLESNSSMRYVDTVFRGNDMSTNNITSEENAPLYYSSNNTAQHQQYSSYSSDTSCVDRDNMIVDEKFDGIYNDVKPFDQEYPISLHASQDLPPAPPTSRPPKSKKPKEPKPPRVPVIHKCKECDRVFKNSTQLKNHMWRHTGEKPFTCDQCGSKFTQQGNLRAHRRIHTGERPYECSVCKHCFTQLSTLKTHQKIHSDERPHKCHLCDAAFRQVANLKTHQVTHTGERPHKCEMCDKAFTQKSNLKAHRNRVHNPDGSFAANSRRGRKKNPAAIKPYSCQECGAKFTMMSNLKIHLKLHSGNRNYSCDMCSAAFSHRTNLKTHIQRMHNCPIRKKVRCDECPSTFRLKRCLKIHKKRRHPIKSLRIKILGESKYFMRDRSCQGPIDGDVDENLLDEPEEGEDRSYISEPIVHMKEPKEEPAELATSPVYDHRVNCHNFPVSKENFKQLEADEHSLNSSVKMEIGTVTSMSATIGVKSINMNTVSVDGQNSLVEKFTQQQGNCAHSIEMNEEHCEADLGIVHEENHNSSRLGNNNILSTKHMITNAVDIKEIDNTVDLVENVVNNLSSTGVMPCINDTFGHGHSGVLDTKKNQTMSGKQTLTNSPTCNIDYKYNCDHYLTLSSTTVGPMTMGGIRATKSREMASVENVMVNTTDAPSIEKVTQQLTVHLDILTQEFNKNNNTIDNNIHHNNNNKIYNNNSINTIHGDHTCKTQSSSLKRSRSDRIDGTFIERDGYDEVACGDDEGECDDDEGECGASLPSSTVSNRRPKQQQVNSISASDIANSSDVSLRGNDRDRAIVRDICKGSSWVADEGSCSHSTSTHAKDVDERCDNTSTFAMDVNEPYDCPSTNVKEVNMSIGDLCNSRSSTFLTEVDKSSCTNASLVQPQSKLLPVESKKHT